MKIKNSQQRALREVKSQKVQNFYSIFILEITQGRRKEAKLEIFNLLILTSSIFVFELRFLILPMYCIFAKFQSQPLVFLNGE